MQRTNLRTYQQIGRILFILRLIGSRRFGLTAREVLAEILASDLPKVTYRTIHRDLAGLAHNLEIFCKDGKYFANKAKAY